LEVQPQQPVVERLDQQQEPLPKRSWQEPVEREKEAQQDQQQPPVVVATLQLP
jgi:hypothetical protein